MNNLHAYFQLAILAFVVLSWIVGSIVRFVKWTARKRPGAPLAANTAPQSIANVQPVQAPPPSQPPPPPASPPQTYPNYAARLTPQELLLRQPQAGGPIVVRDATDTDFQRQEAALIADEPAPLGVALQSIAPAPIPMKKLFGNTDDLVRAFILREALGPPLSRRLAQSTPPSPPQNTGS